jgi:tRNA modification GTPase
MNNFGEQIMKTIVALATPPLNSAIHIIRVSGEETFSIINKICQPKLKKSGYEIQKVGIFHDKKQIDHVLVNKFIAPKSFTGEDIVEINCHGGLFLAEKIIKLLLKYGCQLAQPGEFTMRAVLNNKINLIQAEAINNLVKAQNDYAIQIANIGLNKKVDNDLKKYKEIIFSLVSKYEITIDYPDMDETINNKHVIQTLQKLINEFCSIIKTSKQINAYSHGINIAIVGEVNVGKSSLLNAFAKQERAIVTTTPGTTRDVIQVSVNIDGLTFNFYDTAGIR